MFFVVRLCSMFKVIGFLYFKVRYSRGATCVKSQGHHMAMMHICSCFHSLNLTHNFGNMNVSGIDSLWSKSLQSLGVFPENFSLLQELQSAPLPLITCHHHLSFILCHRRREEDAFQCHNAPLVRFFETVPLCQCCCCCCCPGTRQDGGQFAADSCLLCHSPPAGWIWKA